VSHSDAFINTYVAVLHGRVHNDFLTLYCIKGLKMRYVKLAFFCSLALIGGCGGTYFVAPKENPVIEDSIGKSLFRTMSTTSERRIIIVNDMDGSPNRGLFCAEPSPDSSDNLASSFSSYLKASEKADLASADVAGGLDKALSTTVQQLGRRSQGLQFFRDASYTLCNAYLNGLFEKTSYLDNFKLILNASQGLIDTELRFKDSVISAPTEQLKSPQQQLSELRAASLEEIKSRTAEQAEKDKLESARLTAELERKKKDAEALLEVQTATNKIEEGRRQHELNMKTKELEILKKQEEINKQTGVTK